MTRIAIVILASGIGAAACGSTAVDPNAVAFAYADSTGSRLLSLASDDTSAVPLQSLTEAVCSSARTLRVRYAGFQERHSADDGRQSTANFSRDRGHLFEVDGEPAMAGDTCLLASAQWLLAYPIVPNELTREQLSLVQPSSPATGESELEASMVDRMAEQKGRAPARHWLLYRGGKSRRIVAVEFEALVRDRLASVVLIGPQQLAFLDLPATGVDPSCWRVDDECRFDAGGMEIVALFGEPGHELVFFTWWAFEGQSVSLLKNQDGTLVDVRSAYRYHAPT